MAPPAEGGGDGGAGGDGGGRGVQQQQQQPQPSGFGQTITGIIRMFVFFYFLSKFFGPKKPTEPSQLISNLFQKGESMILSCLIIGLLRGLELRHPNQNYMHRLTAQAKVRGDELYDDLRSCPIPTNLPIF